jgi:hypothetical protein
LGSNENIADLLNALGELGVKHHNGSVEKSMTTIFDQKETP